MYLRCPSFFMPLPVVFYADGRENLRLRPSPFSPVLIQHRPDLRWKAGAEQKQKTRFDMLGMAINTHICPAVTIH